jgi:hypothetical protein
MRRRLTRRSPACVRHVVTAAVALALLPAAAGAQAAGPPPGGNLTDRIADIFRFGECDQPLCLPVAAGEHGNHYVPAVVEGQSNLLSFLTGSISASVANLPVAASSGGATFRFVEGRPVRETISGGPIFAERARTLGRGRLFLGANLSGFEFQSLRGVPLNALVFNFTHEDVGAPGLGDPAFENDIIQVTTDLDVSVLATTFVATYGMHDRVDVGVAVPLVRTAIRGSALATVIPFGPGSPHVFGTTDDPRHTAFADTYGSAFGVGDIAARVKALLLTGQTVDLAVVGEARLPTGREEDLLGAGHLAVRALGIASARFGSFSPHVNAGYLFRNDSLQSDAALVTLGFDQLMSPWATLAVDVISRWQMQEGGARLPEPVQIALPTPRTVQVTNIPGGRDHVIDGSLGFRLTTSDGITVVTNALIPIRRSGGLQPSIAWSAGLEYAF